jgi:hypothetical protein
MSISPDKFPAIISVSNPGVGATLIGSTKCVKSQAVWMPKYTRLKHSKYRHLLPSLEFAGFMSYWQDAASVKVINPLETSI